MCQAAVGRFDQALDSWAAWTRFGPRAPGEEAEEGAVERMRQAVQILVRELERYRE
jgi:hypothetical protein